MKIAYLITAFSDYRHLRLLVDALNDPGAAFYIHVDKKSELPMNFAGCPNVIFIERIKVYWGGWSHQQAILNLMSEASRRRYDYYVLISGTDYPIRPNEFLYARLREGGEFINIIAGFHGHKPESRVKFYHFDCFDRRKTKSLKTRFYLLTERVLSLVFRKKNYPFKQIYHGSTWWALTHGCVSYVLEFVKNNRGFVDFFRSTWCPEESFIHTIIGASAYLPHCKTNLTYTDWSSEPAPAFVNARHVELFKTQAEFDGTYGKYQPFFARKFSDSSDAIVAMIESERKG